MLFNENPQIQLKESYKERNLYYKIFAGYIFNELIPDYNQRKHDFLDLIKAGSSCKMEEIEAVVGRMKDAEIHVDFDHHACQVDKELTKSDRGEFADILISSAIDIIAIEAKVLSNWSIEKDITKNQERIEKVVRKINICNSRVVHVLLVSAPKIHAAEKMTHSHYNRLKDKAEIIKMGFAIITWEDICEKIIRDKTVKTFLLRHLEDCYKSGKTGFGKTDMQHDLKRFINEGI